MDPTRFPPPHDEAAAARLIDAFPGKVDPALLGALGGNSPYLAELALREPQTLCALVALGPDAVCDQALGRLGAVRPGLSRAAVAAALRAAKRQVALCAAVADIGGLWSLEQITGALSDLAEGALRLAVAHLLLGAHGGGELRLAHPQAPARFCGFTVLAMGKLGARELNFSSDVDLILIFDPETHAYNAERLGAIFARLARDLVSLMQTRDADGYVFRTDLRLRPDPGSTPLAVSLPTALAYYEGTAQTWERAAMIKARPIAGDLALGRRFLEAIRPFIWRRHLDFAAIADMRAMKQRMDQARDGTLSGTGSAAQRVLGHDLKLGQGGIREIEFSAQVLQLVWGGCRPALRVAGTLDCLAAARAAGLLSEQRARDLAAAYQFLRRAEHRLQMVDDRQTHSLPRGPEGLAAFAWFFTGQSPRAFATTLLAHLSHVHAAFADLLRRPPQAPDMPREPGLAMAVPAEAAIPPAMGAAWRDGRPRGLRSARARDLLAELLPALGAAVARQKDPAQVWVRLDAFFHRLPAGVQILSLLRHNPALLDRLADMMGAAPSLAEYLASVPASLEGLLAPGVHTPPPLDVLRAQLGDVTAIDEALGIASRFVRGEEFRLAIAELDGRIDQDEAGAARAALAEAVITTLLPLVHRDHVRRYGRLIGGGLVVVALGKMGGREMLFGSDLDLMLIYDGAEEPVPGAHVSSMAPSQYFARYAQAIIAALTVPTRDGKLYEVDMRLRPSGGKGPVAVSLAAFTRYHRDSAWTWERLALTRARVVAGPRALRRRVAACIVAAMLGGDRAAILPDTLAMRRRLAADAPPRGPWDVKARAGGMIELAFLVQALQLRAGRAALPQTALRDALPRLVRAGALSRAEAEALASADRVWRGVQGLLRITGGQAIPASLPAPVLDRLERLLERLTGARTGQTVEAQLDAVAASVRAAFIRHVGEIDAHAYQ